MIKPFSFLVVLILVSCTTTQAPPIYTVDASLAGAQSAVINLNILNRDARLSALSSESNLLFSANVGDVDTVTYTENIAEQTFIALSDNPVKQSSVDWNIQISPAIPMSYVVDVIDGTFNADFTGLELPRFDIVSSNSTVDMIFPASAFQLAVDNYESSSTLMIPDGAEVQSAQVISNGGLMSLTVETQIGFIATVSVISGGLTITVPTTTGVQLMVQTAINSEITLPGSPRITAEATSYTTPDFEQSTSQILLNGTLNAAMIRIVQE